VRARLEGAGDRFASWRESGAAGKFAIVSRSVADGSEQRWLVDIAARTVTADVTADADDADDADDAEWAILGSAETWQAVLAGRVNLHTALRRCDLRYCSAGEDGVLATQTRIAMLADVLGLSSWRQSGTTGQDTAGQDAAEHTTAAAR
jgi:hypothetical protein